MGGFVTAGMTGPLVTVGLGSEASFVFLDTRPKGGGTMYHKKRVRGVHVDEFSKITVLRSVIVKSEIPITILDKLDIDVETRVKLLEKILKKFEHPIADLRMTVLTRYSKTKYTIKQHYLTKTDTKTSILGDKIMKFIEKVITIKEHKTKKEEKKSHILNTEGVLSDVEITNMLDLIKKVEELEETEDE